MRVLTGASATSSRVELVEHGLDAGIVKDAGQLRGQRLIGGERGHRRCGSGVPRPVGRVGVQAVAHDAVVRVAALEPEAGLVRGRLTMKLSAVVWRP